MYKFEFAKSLLIVAILFLCLFFVIFAMCLLVGVGALPSFVLGLIVTIAISYAVVKLVTRHS